MNQDSSLPQVVDPLSEEYDEEELALPLAKNSPSLLDSVLAGSIRSTAYALKHAGISARAVQVFVTKRAFLNIGSRTNSCHNIDGDAILDRVKPQTSPTASVSQVVVARSLGFLKGAILGFAVFGVYDILILQEWFFPRPKDLEAELLRKEYIRRRQRSNSVRLENVGPIIERTPLVAHIVAGALAGLFQSFVMDAWEVTHYWWTHRRKDRLIDHWGTGVNMKFIKRRLIHHSVGYATLFGVYETVRRSIRYVGESFFSSEFQSAQRALFFLEEKGLVAQTDSGAYDMKAIPLTASFLAGGVAGQAHFIVSYYSSHLKLLSSKQKVRKLPKAPAVRSVASSFLPTAFSFLAFQYGAEFAERLLENGE